MRAKHKENFAKEVSDISPNIEVLGQYTDWNTPVLCKCRVCEHEWNGRAAVLLYGGGCPKCSRKKANKSESLALEEVVKRIKKVFPSIEVIGEYKGVHTKLKCRCLIDLCEWEAQPAHLFKGESGCPICKKDKMRQRFALSQEEFQSAVYKKNPNIIVVGTYVNNNEPIECSCTIHKNTFMARPRNLLYKDGNACPLCFQSMGEQRMLRILKEHGFKIDTQHTFDDCVYQKHLKFDAYDEVNNIAYEYQGEQHYKPVNFNGYDKEKSKIEYEKGLIRDQIKRDYCFNNNITLIEIPYWELDNMEEFLISKWKVLQLAS